MNDVSCLLNAGSWPPCLKNTPLKYATAFCLPILLVVQSRALLSGKSGALVLISWEATGLTIPIRTHPESVLSMPPHGVQLEVRRGFPPTAFTRAIPLLVERRFLPLPSVLDIVINEGLYGWNVRYYLTIVKTSRQPFGDVVSLNVIFEVHVLIFDARYDLFPDHFLLR